MKRGCVRNLRGSVRFRPSTATGRDYMLGFVRSIVLRLRCTHDFRYSRTKPGTLVCKRCRARRRP